MPNNEVLDFTNRVDAHAEIIVEDGKANVQLYLTDDEYKELLDRTPLAAEYDFETMLKDTDITLTVTADINERGQVEMYITVEDDTKQGYPSATVELSAEESQSLVEDAERVIEAQGSSLKTLFAEEQYEQFKDEWVKDHIDDVTMTATEAAYENAEEAADMTFEEYVEAYGYENGEIYPSFEEFYDNELPLIQLADEIEQHMFERGEYEFSEDDTIRWIKDDRESTTTAIRTAIEDEPAPLLDYLADELHELDEGSDDYQRASRLLEGVKEYCEEHDIDLENDKPDKSTVERD